MTHGASEMKSAPGEPFQLLCALVLFLCRCLSPRSLGFSGLLLESSERCPSYTSCIWKQVSSSSTSRSLPRNMCELFHRSKKQEPGKYFMNQYWFMILINFFPWKGIFQPLLNLLIRFSTFFPYVLNWFHKHC